MSGARSTGRATENPIGGTGTQEALARLEAAVERLAIAAGKPRPMATGEGVSRAQVQAIADRLDETIARLRTALGEEG
ncbi:hypothetical protein [Falsiroseomonas sp. HW251]|uniref:hypothetical protein n=1 Tax=Falsiroseomonas sp. HW251 TaxID=3390998 RepID=UPI003D3133B0